MLEPLKLSVLCVYEPTNRAPYSVNGTCSNDLQVVLDCINIKDVLVILGDFNARVGSGISSVTGATGDCSDADLDREYSQVWHSVPCQHGCGQCNGAGEEFCHAAGVCVCVCVAGGGGGEGRGGGRGVVQQSNVHV